MNAVYLAKVVDFEGTQSDVWYALKTRKQEGFYEKGQHTST